jgi:hypothetical protein
VTWRQPEMQGRYGNNLRPTFGHINRFIGLRRIVNGVQRHRTKKFLYGLIRRDAFHFREIRALHFPPTAVFSLVLTREGSAAVKRDPLAADYQKWAMRALGGPDLPLITVVEITTCTFLCAQLAGARAAIVSIYAGSLRNSPAAMVP